MMKKALLVAIALLAITVAINRGVPLMDGDPPPWCPPICAP